VERKQPLSCLAPKERTALRVSEGAGESSLKLARLVVSDRQAPEEAAQAAVSVFLSFVPFQLLNEQGSIVEG